MQRKNSTVTKTQRRRAQRIINAPGKYSEKICALVRTTLNENPSQLPRVLTAIDQLDSRIEGFSKGIHAFASQAYFAALNFYSLNHDNPAALAAFTRALRVRKER